MLTDGATHGLTALRKMILCTNFFLILMQPDFLHYFTVLNVFLVCLNIVLFLMTDNEGYERADPFFYYYQYEYFIFCYDFTQGIVQLNRELKQEVVKKTIEIQHPGFHLNGSFPAGHIFMTASPC